MIENQALAIFEGKNLRKIWENGQWYFSLVDIIEILTDSPTPRKYWDKVKRKLKEEGANQTSLIWRQFKLKASDGRLRATDCANTEGVLRIIMSVPSPKAEPFREWLANVGAEYIEETENPELAIERMREIYKAKGYPDEWIERRMQTIEIRRQLTDEWQKRGIKEGQEYAVLTATIAKGTFGVTPSEHSAVKNLEKQNLRDHMTPLELIFTALGEELTRDEVVKNDAQGFNENHEAAVKGGSIAGEARERVETLRGNKIVSSENFLNKIEEQEKIED